MAQRISRYFEDCQGEVLRDENGKPVIRGGKPVMVGAEPPTVTGLAYALGFESRQSLLNYQGKAAFERLIGDAKMRIQAYTEGRLFDREGVRGAEFSLRNNFGWEDRHQQELTVEPVKSYDEIMDEIAQRLGEDEIEEGNK